MRPKWKRGWVSTQLYQGILFHQKSLIKLNAEVQETRQPILFCASDHKLLNMRQVYIFCAILLLITASSPEAKTLALNLTIDSFLASNVTVFNAMKPIVSQTPIRARRKRYITQSDMVAILDYHNQVRANVFPPAANMEYMVRKYICTFRFCSSELANENKMLQHFNNVYNRCIFLSSQGAHNSTL